MAVRAGLARRILIGSGVSGLVYYAALAALALSNPDSSDNTVQAAPLVAVAMTMATLAEPGSSRRRPEGPRGKPGDRDPLTGLGGRQAFTEHTKRYLRTASAGAIAVALIDAAGVGRINQTCGREAGDQLLAIAARAFTRAGGRSIEAFRLAGDRFAIVVRRSAGGRLSSVLLALADGEVMLAACGHAHQLELSIGFASCVDGESFESLCRRAEARLLEDREHPREDSILSYGAPRPRPSVPISLGAFASAKHQAVRALKGIRS